MVGGWKGWKLPFMEANLYMGIQGRAELFGARFGNIIGVSP